MYFATVIIGWHIEIRQLEDIKNYIHTQNRFAGAFDKKQTLFLFLSSKITRTDCNNILSRALQFK